MDFLYVRCTLEHYDTTSAKHFDGALFVDTSDKSFTVSGAKEKYKFFAREFTRLGKPPIKSSATQFALEFDLSKQPPARMHVRKRSLIFKMTDTSHKVKEVYDELRKIFPKTASPTRSPPNSITSPVGMLRSCNGSRPNRASGRTPSAVSDRSRSNRISELSTPSGSFKQRGCSQKSSLRGTSIRSKNDDADSVTSHHQRTTGSSTKSIIEHLDDEEIHDILDTARPSTSSENRMAESRQAFPRTSQKPVENAISNEQRKISASREVSLSQASRPSTEMGAQGSVIALMEKKMSEKCDIKVTAPFSARAHTVTFRGKRNNDSGPISDSMVKRSVHGFGHNQQNEFRDNVNSQNGLTSSSFYGTSKTPPNVKTRLPGEIISPGPQLVADSVSSSRCLLSPPSRASVARESSTHSSSYKTPTRFDRKNLLFDPDEEDNLLATTAMPTAVAEPSPYSYRGLENLTNSCFMNATLQALASVFDFYYRLQVIMQLLEGGSECSEFVKRFNDVLQNLVSPERVLSNKYGSATDVSVLIALKAAAGKELGSDPDFGSSAQQDAHEFLAKTLEIVEKEAVRCRAITCSRSSTSTSPWNRNPAAVFQHKIRNRYGCERCARASEMTNDAIDLTVTVSVGESIQRMIEHALAREEIEYKCDNCGPGSGFISRAFATLPQSLIIVVKRYRFGEAGGTKIDEKISVSRELFLKNLYYDSDVKRREGMAKKSDASHSPSALVYEAKQNGHANCNVPHHHPVSEDAAATSRSELQTCTERKDDHVVEVSRSVSNPESTSYSSVSQSLTKNSQHAERNSSEGTELPTALQLPARPALSPLKMNRSLPVRLGKVEDTVSPGRNMGVAQSDIAVSLSLPCNNLEKENAVDAMVKQSGGYLEENGLDVEKTQSSGKSTVSAETLHLNSIETVNNRPEDINLERNVGALKIDDSDDPPKKRSRFDKESPETTILCHSNAPANVSNSYARLITEPLRPSSQPHSTKSTERSQVSTPGLEQISVPQQSEEKTFLIFRPVTEECQKMWCARFGFKYAGSPELRKRVFGREIEFSSRDVPLSCDVRGDGNCLFRTLCWWITGGSDGQHFSLREKLIAFMTQHCTRFASLLNSQEEMDIHLLRMSEDGEWGTQVELAAAACWLGVNIYTFLEGKWLKYRPLFRWSTDGSPLINLSLYECRDENGAIFICNASGCHFQPAVGIDTQATLRRNLRPRRDRDVQKETSSPSRTANPPYVFDSSDGPVYSLAAVICHHGDSLLSGHYSTFSLDATKREWLDCNDNCVTKTSEVDVIDSSSTAGYIFIYNRLEDPHKRL